MRVFWSLAPISIYLVFKCLICQAEDKKQQLNLADFTLRGEGLWVTIYGTGLANLPDSSYSLFQGGYPQNPSPFHQPPCTEPLKRWRQTHKQDLVFLSHSGSFPARLPLWVPFQRACPRRLCMSRMILQLVTGLLTYRSLGHLHLKKTKTKKDSPAILLLCRNWIQFFLLIRFSLWVPGNNHSPLSSPTDVLCLELCPLWASHPLLFL